MSFLSDWRGRRRERKTLAQARDFRKQIESALRYDDDILEDGVKKRLRQISDDLAKSESAEPGKLENALEKSYGKFADTYPVRKHRTIREYLDIIAVALTVAFGVRALYIQPFKIPTSSMQPTLFGIHYIEKDSLPDLPQPLAWALYSARNAKLEIRRSGVFRDWYPQITKLFFFPTAAFNIGGVKYELPGEIAKVKEYAFHNAPGLREFHRGEVVCDGWLSQGDHLFVDRLTYHFSDPRRGDIVVFTTEGLSDEGAPLISRGYYYVKRLIGLPGDTLKIIDDVVQVKEKGAECFTPVTEFGVDAINRIYSFKGGYHGHGAVKLLAEGNEFQVPEDCYFMMGDNTSHSSDSRFWGVVPRRNISGKAFFVFWPLSRRWGFVDQAVPLPPSTPDPISAAAAMSLQ